MFYFANFKANKNEQGILDYFKVFNNFKNFNDEICFFLPLELIVNTNLIDKINFNIGVQDIDICNAKDVEMLLNLGVKYTLIGHSERRTKFGETNEIIANKLSFLSKYNLCKVLCVGETFEEKENKFEVVCNQIFSALDNLNNFNQIVIAYEPIWAIGTNITPQALEIENMISFIKKCLSEKYKYNFPILYGGSVCKENITSFKTIKNLDGFLVGGASLDPQGFYNLIKS